MFSELEPFGTQIDDFHTAQIVHAIAEVNRNPKKRGRKFEISDFMSDWEKAFDARFRGVSVDGKATTPEQMQQFAKSFTAQWKAKYGKAGRDLETDKSDGTATILGPDGKPAR